MGRREGDQVPDPPRADPWIRVEIHVQVGVQYDIQLDSAGVPLSGPVVCSIVCSSVPPGVHFQYIFSTFRFGGGTPVKTECTENAPPAERGFPPKSRGRRDGDQVPGPLRADPLENAISTQLK